MAQNRSTAPADAPADPAVDSDERAALDADYAALYDELRAIARRHLRGESAGHTMGVTALIHESYLKLADLDRHAWRDRAQFFALASRAMRHILVDHARGRKTHKRGGGMVAVTLNADEVAGSDASIDVLALDDALARLRALDRRLEQVVECRFFGGMTATETAAALGVSQRTVERDWTRARAYLHAILDEGAAGMDSNGPDDDA